MFETESSICNTTEVAQWIRSEEVSFFNIRSKMFKTKSLGKGHKIQHQLPTTKTRSTHIQKKHSSFISQHKSTVETRRNLQEDNSAISCIGNKSIEVGQKSHRTSSTDIEHPVALIKANHHFSKVDQKKS